MSRRETTRSLCGALLFSEGMRAELGCSRWSVAAKKKEKMNEIFIKGH